LVGQLGNVTGTANRTHVHSSIGVLVGPGSTIVGASSILKTHYSSGAIVANGAIIAGTSDHISLYPLPQYVQEGIKYGPSGMYVGTLIVGVNPIIRLRSFTEKG